MTLRRAVENIRDGLVADVVGSIMISRARRVGRARYRREPSPRWRASTRLKNTLKETGEGARQSAGTVGDARNNCDLRFGRWQSKARRVRLKRWHNRAEELVSPSETVKKAGAGVGDDDDVDADDDDNNNDEDGVPGPGWQEGERKRRKRGFPAF